MEKMLEFSSVVFPAPGVGANVCCNLWLIFIVVYGENCSEQKTELT